MGRGRREQEKGRGKDLEHTLFSASFWEVEEEQFGKKGCQYRRERKQCREVAAELQVGGRGLPTWVVGGIIP